MRYFPVCNFIPLDPVFSYLGQEMMPMPGSLFLGGRIQIRYFKGRIRSIVSRIRNPCHKPFITNVVDERVDATVRHRQPVENQVHIPTNIGLLF